MHASMMHVFMMHVSIMLDYAACVYDAGFFRYEHTFNGRRRSSSSRRGQGYYLVGCIMDTCFMETCIMDTSAWVTRPECPKGAKDEVMQARRAAS